MIKKIKKIKLLILDVDGVMTDGKIIYDSAGTETKNFDVQDGMGMVLFQKLGYRLAIISARASNVVKVRAKDLGIKDVYLNAYPKTGAYKKLLKKLSLKDAEVCFIADDITDLSIFTKVGFAVAVKNARQEVKHHADYITKRNGGDGAVREVIELILKRHGQWKKVISEKFS